jgi:hypothetical protein
MINTAYEGQNHSFVVYRPMHHEIENEDIT